MKRALCAAGLAAVCAQSPPAKLPSFPTSFTVTGSINLPYANLTEQFTTWVDGVGGNQRIEYYAGLDTYIANQASGNQWQVRRILSDSIRFHARNCGTFGTGGLG